MISGLPLHSCGTGHWNHLLDNPTVAGDSPKGNLLFRKGLFLK